MKLRCHECGRNCGINHDDKLVYRAYIVCHDCLGKVPLAVLEAFQSAMHSTKPKRYIETPADEFGPLPPDAEIEQPKLRTKSARKQPKLKDLTVHDRLEVKHFQKYLTLAKKHGEGALRQRPFWRKYLGLEPLTDQADS
jgi:hypothetical protein